MVEVWIRGDRYRIEFITSTCARAVGIFGTFYSRGHLRVLRLLHAKRGYTYGLLSSLRVARSALSRRVGVLYSTSVMRKHGSKG